MMPLPKFPEPSTFNVRVRQPGIRFLATNPNPTNSEFRNKNYWSRVHSHLHSVYSGICAYSCAWTTKASASNPRDGDHSSIDHFVSKCRDPINPRT